MFVAIAITWIVTTYALCRTAWWVVPIAARKGDRYVYLFAWLSGAPVAALFVISCHVFGFPLLGEW